MKRIIILIIAMVAIFHAPAQQRQQVTREEVTCIAMRLLATPNAPTDCTVTNLQMSEKRDSLGNVLLYEVTADSISVLLSGSRACYPLLGKYKTPNGSLLDNYDNLPHNLQWLIDGYIAQIVPCFSTDTIRLYYNDEWNNLIEDINLSNRDIDEVILDFPSKWQQKGCNNSNLIIGYEYYMPPDANNSCVHSSVGCGAVAMGQVLNYWKHPVSSDWNVTYDWCNMSDLLDVNSPSFLKNREAIALLLKDCASLVTVNYQCEEGSPSDFARIPSALINFKYSSDAHIEQRRNHPDDWGTLLKNQIDQGRPIIYKGGAHTFVCHGYHDDHQGGFFIMLNMGNGYIGNGWYTPNDISFYHPTTGIHYDFTSNQSAIIDIYPNNQIPLCNRNLVLDDYYNQYLDATLNPWDIPPVTVTNLTSASITSDATWRTIPSGATTTYRAQESITLRDGFTVEEGADFAAKISPCDNCGSSEQFISEYASFGPRPFENGEGGRNGFPQQEEFASFLENGVVEGVDAKEPFTLMPNPASDYVDLLVHELGEDARGGTLTLHDVMGNERFRRVIRKGESRLTLPLDGLSSGYYFVTLKTSRGTNIQKLVIN